MEDSGTALVSSMGSICSAGCEIQRCWFCLGCDFLPLLLPSEDGISERSSPKSEIEINSEPPEEKVTARAGASCPSGGHVADIYLANINK